MSVGFPPPNRQQQTAFQGVNEQRARETQLQGQFQEVNPPKSIGQKILGLFKSIGRFFKRLFTGKSDTSQTTSIPHTNDQTISTTAPIESNATVELQEVTSTSTGPSPEEIAKNRMATQLSDLKTRLTDAQVSENDPITEQLTQWQNAQRSTWDLAQMESYIREKTQLLEQWAQIKNQAAQFQTSVDALPSDELKTAILEKKEILNTVSSFEDRVNGTRDWIEWGQSYIQFQESAASAKKAAQDATTTYSDAFKKFKVDEHHFQKGFFKFKVFFAKEFSYVESKLMKEPLKAVRALLGKQKLTGADKAAFKEQFSQLMQKMKALYLELEFRDVYTHFINTQYQATDDNGNFTNGLRSREAIMADISKGISDYLDHYDNAPPQAHETMQQLLHKSMEKPIKGLVDAAKRNGSIFVTLSLTKDAFAAVPRFYAMALNTVEEESARMQTVDAKTISAQELKQKTAKLDTMATIVGTLGQNGAAQLIGDATELQFTDESFKAHVESAINQYQRENPQEPGDQFSPAFKMNLSMYAWLRARDKEIVSADGQFIADKQRTVDAFKMRAEKRGKPSYDRFQQLYARSERDMALFTKLEPILNERLKSAFSYRLGNRGLGRQMRQVRDNTDRYNKIQNNLERAKAAFILKWRNAGGSWFRKAKAAYVIKNFVKENLTLEAFKAAPKLTDDLTNQIESVSESIETGMNAIDSIVSKLSGGTISVADATAFHEVMEQVESVIGHVEFVTDQLPYYGQIKSGLALGYHLIQYFRHDGKADKLGREIVAAKELGDYFTSDQLQDPAIRARMSNQIEGLARLMDHKDEASQALSEAIIDVINLASPIQVGSLIREVKSILELDLPNKEEVYQRIAQDTLTIVSEYKNVAKGDVQTDMQTLFSELGTKAHTDYDVSRAVQRVADHLPGPDEFRSALEVL